MKLNLQIDYADFEIISENSEKKLIGGFSSSLFIDGSIDPIDGSNNCNSGNCIEGCGKGQNVNCNTVAGCGTV